jgi:drug/metabolite transporter (DMT)-like permease
MFLAAAALLVPVAVVAPAPENKGDWMSAAAALLFLGIVGTGLATLLFNKLIREQGPLFAGMTTNLVPLGAVMIAWLDAEQTTFWQIAALVGILAMVTLVQYRAASRADQTNSRQSEMNVPKV